MAVRYSFVTLDSQLVSLSWRARNPPCCSNICFASFPNRHRLFLGSFAAR